MSCKNRSRTTSVTIVLKTCVRVCIEIVFEKANASGGVVTICVEKRSVGSVPRGESKCTLSFGVFCNPKEFFDKNDKLYIASGGNQEEIKALCFKWNIYKYFSGIYGSPKKKIDISKKIRKLHEKNNIYFYGDAKYDYECSKKIDSEFIFVSGYSESKNWYKNEMGRKIFTLQDLIINQSFP